MHKTAGGFASESCRCYRCDDNNGEFFFENGATAHYTFANAQHKKGLADARREHRNKDLSSYDVVFMNRGNLPSMSSDLSLIHI